MACHQCFHNSVCGSSSPYSDSSECKTFVDKDSVVPIELLHKHRDAYEKLNDERRGFIMNIRSLEGIIEKNEEELRYLRVIKQTLEMCSGKKFDI